MAINLGRTPLARRASPAAPVPRPPHPTSTIWMVEFSAACTDGIATPASAETAAACPTRLPNSRREIGVFSREFMDCSSARELETNRTRWIVDRPGRHARACRHVGIYRIAARAFHRHPIRLCDRQLIADEPSSLLPAQGSTQTVEPVSVK